MFSVVQRSAPWKKADKKKRHSDGDETQVVPFRMYEKLQLQLMETLNTLAERDSEVSALTSRVKVQAANASAFTYKLETLETTIQEKECVIEKLEQELAALRASGTSGPSAPQASTKPKDSKKGKKQKKEKNKKPKSKSSLSGSHHGPKKSCQKKKKKSNKRITLHNHELAKEIEKRKEGHELSASFATTGTKEESVGSSSEDSFNRGKAGLNKPLEPQHEFETDAVDSGDNVDVAKEEPLDDSMHSQANLYFSPGFLSNSKRRSLAPSHRFWKFRAPQLVSPICDRPFLDPTMLEMIDEVSDLTRSNRSEFSVSIWSPSPVVKRKEIAMSEADKAAIGISGLSDSDNVAETNRRLSLPSLPLVDEQSGGNLDGPKFIPLGMLGRSNSMKEGRTWCQMDEISIVEEGSIEEEESIEEEIIDDSDDDDDEETLYEEILEDDSIASSSMSC